MKPDRLAAHRAAQAAQAPQSHAMEMVDLEGGRSPPLSPSYQSGGQPYSPNPGSDQYDGPPPTTTQPDFWNKAVELQDSIAVLQRRINGLPDVLNPTRMESGTAQKSSVGEVDEIRQEIENLKREVDALSALPPSDDPKARANRIKLLRQKLLSALRDVLDIERNARRKNHDHITRQLKIVNPDATEEQLNAALNHVGDEGVFADALLHSNRYASSNAAYKEVQDRQRDIANIEKTMEVLSRMMQDLATIVQEQDAEIDRIAYNMDDTVKNTEAGVSETDKALVSARKARRKRKILFVICILIIAVVAIIIAVVVTNNKK